MNFNNILATLNETVAKPCDEKKIKQLRRIFSLIVFDEIKEQQIFERLSKGSAKPLIHEQMEFKCFQFFSCCKKLKALERANIKDNDDVLLNQIKNLLNFLGKNYSSASLAKDAWDKIYDYLAYLNIPLNKKKSLLEIFLQYKKPNTTSNYLYNMSVYIATLPLTLFYSLRSNTIEGEPSWKGKKYLTILKATRQYVLDHENLISEKLSDSDNPPALKEKVKELIDYLTNLAFPKLNERKKYKALSINSEKCTPGRKKTRCFSIRNDQRKSSLDERKAYNSELRKMSQDI